MAQNVTIAGASYSDVPAIDIPKTGGGAARFVDTSDADAAAGDILSGKTAYVNGQKITGTGSGGAGGEYNIISTENPDGTQSLSITGAAGGTAINPLTVTANGTYTAPANTAYNPVTVNVPNPSSGTLNITENGTYDVTDYASAVVSVSGGGMNKQICFASGSIASTSYTAVSGITLTVEKTGTYTISYSGWRNRSSGTYGTQLFIDRTGQTQQTSWTNTYGQCVKLTGISLTQGQVLTIKARSSGSAYYTGVANLCIEQTA